MSRPIRARWRFPVVPALIALLCFTGVVVFLYPAAGSWFSEYEQAHMIDEYTVESDSAGTEHRAEQLQNAELYNQRLFGTALVGANQRLPEADPSRVTSDYGQQLATDDKGLMGRLKIPAIDVDLPIYHGTSDAVLAKGVGHLEGTALPVGGVGTHSVLTGHRGLATAELFTRLNELTVGDTFSVEVLGEVLTYKVITTQVVEPDKTQTLYPVVGGDLMTLVTCTPLGVNSHRILVTGERVLPTPPKDLAALGDKAAGPGVPWWAFLLVATAVLLVFYVRWAGVPVRATTPVAAAS